MNSSTTILLFPVYAQVKQYDLREADTVVDSTLTKQKERLLNQLAEKTISARYTIRAVKPDPATRDSLWSEFFRVFGEIGKQGNIRQIASPPTVQKLMEQAQADVAFGLVHLGTTGPDERGYLINTSVIFDRRSGSVIRYGSTVLEKQYPKGDSVLTQLTIQLINKQVR
ncbi:hypothetical protein [Arsenicibacter rosenii]|uniref:hypothetical protein n=1 Tax=Arsenicibacter rosenii TaxID=1750698 RepID=UPI00116032DF|nr:hypothetical protein [Arsenicibacter rosenii]